MIVIGADVEDCRDLSHHLENALIAAGERVIRVAPKLMGVSRRGEREPGKSDQIDARAMRCLKRHLADHHRRLLLTPPSPGTRNDTPINAAISVPCVL